MLDSGDPFTTSGENGSFALNFVASGFDTDADSRLEAEEGRFVAKGGVDIATGLPLSTPLAAPVDSGAITLLTSLVEDLADRGMTVDEAQSAVKAALNLPAGVDLINLNPIAATNSNQPGGVEVLSAMVMGQNFVTQTASLIEGVSNASQVGIVEAVVGAIASQILTGGTLDLSEFELSDY